MENFYQGRIRIFAYIIVVIASLVASCLWFVEMHRWSNSSDSIKLDTMINPNDAPIGSLVRLPGIGLSKAQSIVEYRDKIKITGDHAFHSLDDLQKVQGIGTKTAQDLADFIRFE